MNRLSNRLKFLLERLLLRGAHYRLLLIAALIGLVSIVAGGVVHFFHARLEGGFADAVWWAFLRLSDPGYLGDDTGVLLRTVSTIVTVLGYVLFLGALIAIMTQWLNQKMEDLESGLTPIAVRDHILILGWTNRTAAVVRELVLSEGRVRRFLRRHGARRLRIVILAEQVGAALVQELRERLGPLYDERQVLLRTGTPLRIEHLQRVDFQNAAAIVLPSADFAAGGAQGADTRVIKTLLSITNQARQRPDEPLPTVVAEVIDPRRARVAESAYGGPIEILASDAMIARLIAQNVRHRGLSHVYGELLTHGHGNEVYIRDVPAELVGERTQDLDASFPRAVLLGVVRPQDGEPHPILNPTPGFRIDAGDRFIAMARRYDETEPIPAPRPPVERNATAMPPPAHDKRVLLLGWSHKVPAIIAEFDSYERESFRIDLLSTVSARERKERLDRRGVEPQRVELRHIEGDYTAARDLEAADPASYDNIVLLGSDWLESGEASDARTILGYLLTRELLGDAPSPDLLIELLDPGNVALFRRRAGEVLISPLILSHMLAQVVLRPELSAVFDELFGPRGAEILFAPAANYGPARNFADVQRSAHARGETALGLRRASATGAGVQLNPSRDLELRMDDETEVIVLTLNQPD